jgi:hypothetical protein
MYSHSIVLVYLRLFCFAMMFGHPFGATNNRAAGSITSDDARRNDGIVNKSEMRVKEGGQVAGGLEFKRASATSSSLDHLVQQQRSLTLLGGSCNVSNLNLLLPHSSGSSHSLREQHQQHQTANVHVHRGDGSDSAASDGSDSSRRSQAFPTLKHRARADFQQALNQAEQANAARCISNSQAQLSTPTQQNKKDKVKQQESSTNKTKKVPSITPATAPMTFPQKVRLFS